MMPVAVTLDSDGEEGKLIVRGHKVHIHKSSRIDDFSDFPVQRVTFDAYLTEVESKGREGVYLFNVMQGRSLVLVSIPEVGEVRAICDSVEGLPVEQGGLRRFGWRISLKAVR